MTKVVLTAQVKNFDAWEKSYRTHGEMFRSQGAMESPVNYTGVGNDEVLMCVEVSDVNAYQNLLKSPEILAAMEQDGVKVSTVKLHVLNRELSF